MSRAASLKRGYTHGARLLASRSMLGLARTRVTPDALTACGVGLCVAAAVLVFFENRNEILFYWLAASVFVVGSILDILDGALARTSGKGTPFGAFLDSTTDRVSEGVVLGAIALVFARHHDLVGVMLITVTRRRWLRLLWALWPLWVWFCVMATANHFWLDVVAGVAVALLALALLQSHRFLRLVPKLA